MSLQKSTLFKRMIALARRFAKITDELIGLRGELVEIAESYDTERRLCVRCGTPLDETLRCPACFEREGASRSEDIDGESNAD